MTLAFLGLQLKGFGPLDWIVFVLYMAASVLIGLAFVKEQRTVRDYFLAGRSMGHLIVAISVIAALFSGITYMGAPTEAYRYNLVYTWYLVAFFIATPITAVLFVPFFYNLKLYSAYEYLERRFNLAVRVWSSGLFILRVVLYLALAIYAPSLALAEVTGFPLWLSILSIGILTTIYTTLGGMKAVIWTDVMQFFVLFGGILVTAGYALAKIPGGVDGAWQLAKEGGRWQWVNLDLSLTSRVTTWGALFGLAFAHMVQLATDQISVQRYMTATSLREAQKSLWLKLWITIPMTIWFYLMGTLLYAFYAAYPDRLGVLQEPDRILPYFVVNELPRGIPGVLIAAIFAATMSTVSAGINALTTATLVDFYKRMIRPKAGARVTLRMAKILTAVYGVVATVAAFAMPWFGKTLIEQTNKIMGLLGGPLLGVFFLALLSKRSNGKGALIGGFAGWAFVTFIALRTNISFVWYSAFGCLFAYFVGLLASMFFRPPTAEQIEEYTFRRGRVVEEREEVLPEEWDGAVAPAGGGVPDAAHAPPNQSKGADPT